VPSARRPGRCGCTSPGPRLPRLVPADRTRRHARPGHRHRVRGRPARRRRPAGDRPRPPPRRASVHRLTGRGGRAGRRPAARHPHPPGRAGRHPGVHPARAQAHRRLALAGSRWQRGRPDVRGRLDQARHARPLRPGDSCRAGRGRGPRAEPGRAVADGTQTNGLPGRQHRAGAGLRPSPPGHPRPARRDPAGAGAAARGEKPSSSATWGAGTGSSRRSGPTGGRTWTPGTSSPTTCRR
jgi:hypothetical protein